MLNTDGDGYRFFVHYKGWNSRYDEWVDYKNVTLDVNNETEEVSKNEVCLICTIIKYKIIYI